MPAHTRAQRQVWNGPSFPGQLLPGTLLGAHSAPAQVATYLGTEADGTNGGGDARAGAWLGAQCPAL